MDDNSTVPVATTGASNPDIRKELEHINQEMYKKNLELNERNKTLALLRKIDEIILSSVTNTQQIAQQVAHVVVHESSCKAVIILLQDSKENSLVPVAVSQTDSMLQAAVELPHLFHGVKISLTTDANLVAQAVKARKLMITHDLFDVLQPHYTKEETREIQEASGIVSSFVFPLIAREEILGIMIISTSQHENALSPYQKDLLDRLASVVGIAVDNALLYQKIQDANERLQELDKLKDEFVSLASHELRTPMTVIKSYVWMVLNGKTGPIVEKQKLYLERVADSVERLIKLVNDMLDVSRIESGRMSLDFQDIFIDRIIKEVVFEMSAAAHERGIGIFVHDLDVPVKVHADPNAIKQVLINLIGNSLKFTPRDGGIDVSVKEKDGMVETSVADTGRGIAKADFPKLFKKFGLLGQHYKIIASSEQGTGLGLYIAESIIKLHGGYISASSEGEGKGATFVFTLKKAESKSS